MTRLSPHEGESMILRCSSIDNNNNYPPINKITFYKGNTRLIEEAIGGGTNATRDTFTLRNVSRTDAGSYGCKISNMNFTKSSNNLSIQIRCNCLFFFVNESFFTLVVFLKGKAFWQKSFSLYIICDFEYK